jgi:hypothetical protein
MRAIGDALKLFKDGDSVEGIASSLDELSKRLEKSISSGNILVFREKFYQPVYEFHQDLLVLRTVLHGISINADKKTLEDRLRAYFLKDEDFPFGRFSPNPKKILKKNSDINEILQKEFKGYRSYSWKLALVIFALGAFVALVEILKSYFSI